MLPNIKNKEKNFFYTGNSIKSLAIEKKWNRKSLI